MPSDKTSLKYFLQDVCFPELTARAKYFSIHGLRQFLQKHNVTAASATLLRYLHVLMAEGVIHDAGRGWYSSLATPFVLNHEPVRELVTAMEKCFPLLEFSCWSTERIAGYGHHLLGRFTSFVHTGRDEMATVGRRLRVEGWDVAVNPRGTMAREFETSAQGTVVIRPRATTQPHEGRLVSIEGLLVELFIEARALSLMDAGEFCPRMMMHSARMPSVSPGARSGFMRNEQNGGFLRRIMELFTA